MSTSRVFADDITWLTCDGETTVISNMKSVPYHGRVYGFSESNQSVISGGKTRVAQFNEVAVSWEDEMMDGISARLSVNRSTLKLDVEYVENGKTVGLGSGDCRKTQPPANNQF